MAVAVAWNVRRPASVIDGELELEIGFSATQIDQREIVEREAVDNFQAKCAAIKVDRTRLIENPQHRMDRLGHGAPHRWLARSKRPGSCRTPVTRASGRRGVRLVAHSHTSSPVEWSNRTRRPSLAHAHRSARPELSG